MTGSGADHQLAAGRLRVLRVSERITPLPGGKEIHVEELTRSQLALGDQVTLVFRYGDGAGIAGAEAVRTRLPGRARGVLGAALFGCAVSVRMWRRRDFDVVHLHGDFPNILPLAWLAKRMRVPLVVTVHGLLNKRFQRSAGWMFRRATRFIALGHGVAQDLYDRGVSRERVTVMSSGLNEGLLDQALSLGITPIPQHIVSVGKLDKVKNHRATIRAVLDLPTELEPVLVIIGEGPERAELEALADESPRVRFVGALPRHAVYAEVLRSSVFVIASAKTQGKGEGVPTALLEAMYLHRHCLVSPDSSPSAVVSDDGAYESVQPNSADIGRALLAAFADPEASSAMGTRAHLATSHLAWPEVTKRMRDVLGWGRELV